MHILYVSNLYPPAIGGTQLHLHSLAKEIKAVGHRVHVLTFTSRFRNDWLRLSTIFSEPEKHYVYEGLDVSQIGFSRMTRLRMLPWALSYYALIGPAVRRISACMLPYVENLAGAPSLVHATRNGREFLARTALSFARKHNIPFVLTANHHPRWKGFFYREYNKIYREADALFALTEVEKKTLVEQYGVREERVHVTGVGPLLSESYSAQDFRQDFGLQTKFVLFLGRQCRYKGIKAILDAAPFVWRQHPETRFVFAGPQTDDSRKIFKTVHDRRIVNLGQLDTGTKTSAIAASTLLCLPSTQESFGGVYVEAWSLRKPVIGGRIGPIASLFDDGHDGLLSSQDPRELAETMSYLLSHPELCRAMGDAGWRKVQQRYTWKQLADKTFAVYKKLCI
jgi:glycosyltransferase involved in cell wall biosynthesis